VVGLLLAGLVTLLVGLPPDLPLVAFLESLLSGLLLGAVAALAYLTLYQALAHGPLAIVSPLVPAQGGVTLLVGIVVFKERPAGNQVAGGALLIAGLLGTAAPSSTPLDWPLLAFAGGALLLALLSVPPCRTLLAGWLVLPPLAQWAREVRAIRRLAPCQQHALHRLLHEAVAGLHTLAADHTPACVAFFGGSLSTTADAAASRVAYETARLLAEAGLGILTTNSKGLMEAARRGADDGGTLAVACLLQAARHERAAEQAEEGNPARQDVVVRFSSMVSYQMTISAAACALVFFPGGLDTIEGLAQAICAMQRGELNRVPIVLYERAFWNRLFAWMPDTFEDVSDLLHLCDEPTGIATAITTHLCADRAPSPRQPTPALSRTSNQ
jgi:predicted Rossmann-fold nucleotide-binding protein/uncharacterized membrane protein